MWSFLTTGRSLLHEQYEVEKRIRKWERALLLAKPYKRLCEKPYKTYTVGIDELVARM